jgi:DMSO/TMAO reductase YedYZ molybdopterin-dependent catalytic subunit
MAKEEQATTPSIPNDEAARQMRRLTRRSFVVGGAASLFGLGAWAWLGNSRHEDGIPWPLRRALEANESLARTFLSSSGMAPEFDAALAGEPRVNGRHGLGQKLDAATWRLKIEDPASQPAVFSLTLDDVKSLPRVESVTELKCIEGWSQVVEWAGARFSDFVEKFGLGTRNRKAIKTADHFLRYVSLSTPDDAYYVGLDMASALHPQTLLCYEMNGEPLTEAHGAPLRLVIPVKYGIKSIKRIGTIRFTDDRPADYWAKRGYDWYAGL